MVQALVDLQGNRAWDKVREWLEAELARISEANDQVADDVQLRQGQGAAKALRSLVRHQDDARDELDKHRNR